MSVLGDLFQISNTMHGAAGSIWVPILKYGAVGLVTYILYHQFIRPLRSPLRKVNQHCCSIYMMCRKYIELANKSKEEKKNKILKINFQEKQITCSDFSRKV